MKMSEYLYWTCTWNWWLHQQSAPQKCRYCFPSPQLNGQPLPLGCPLWSVLFPTSCSLQIKREKLNLESFEANSQKGNATETYLCPVRTYHYGICLQTCLHERRFLDPLQWWCVHVLVGVVSHVFLAGTRWKWLSQDHIKALLLLQPPSGVLFGLIIWCRPFTLCMLTVWP